MSGVADLMLGLLECLQLGGREDAALVVAACSTCPLPPRDHEQTTAMAMTSMKRRTGEATNNNNNKSSNSLGVKKGSSKTLLSTRTPQTARGGGSVGGTENGSGDGEDNSASLNLNMPFDGTKKMKEESVDRLPDGGTLPWAGRRQQPFHTHQHID